MGYVFISYSTQNLSCADTFREIFKEEGIDTWMAPYDIPAGSKYAQVISRAIKECSCFLLLLTNAAQESTWVAKEVESLSNDEESYVSAEDDAVEAVFEIFKKRNKEQFNFT